jgi:MarR family 2-MHQ and catechol resistance regulon transcriptional repressor
MSTKTQKTGLAPVPITLEAQRLDADARALHGAVSDLVRVYQLRDRDKICCHDISVTQCYALEILLLRGPMQLNELAAELFLDKSTTSRVIDALERKAYVERIPKADDRRAVALRVTRTGRSLNGRIHRDLIEQQKALLSDLDPELRATVADVIKRLAQAAAARFSAGDSCATSTECCPPVTACSQR